MQNTQRNEINNESQQLCKTINVLIDLFQRERTEKIRRQTRNYDQHRLIDHHLFWASIHLYQSSNNSTVTEANGKIIENTEINHQFL